MGRDDLILASGFEVLNSPCQECFPCIHSSVLELKQLDAVQMKVVSALEREVEHTMFAARYPYTHINELVNASLSKAKNLANNMELFDMGCGSHYVCGSNSSSYQVCW